MPPSRDGGCERLPERVICPTARRARETWQLAAAELDASASVSSGQRGYGAADGELLDLAREIAPRARTLLIVGHDPAMQELALSLATARAGDADALERVRFKFPTAAIAVLEFTGAWQKLRSQQAQLTAFVVPRELRVGSGEGLPGQGDRLRCWQNTTARQRRQPPAAATSAGNPAARPK
ncbi:MAG: SixA phosphatase family protein [Micromonosporaceae bacterium]